jgi:3',5'-cyclic AMP phosphodiesterase CpdA
MNSMYPFRVIQISDTHLSRGKDWFVGNFLAVAGIVAERRPDLVINSGDIAFDGADNEDDLAFARAHHAGLVAPVRAIPGNHDLGDNPWDDEVKQRITALRRDRYRRYFGEDYWAADAGHWRLIGLNAQLLGSGLAAEEDQWSFLAATAASTAERPVALFIHKPLFDERPDETEINGRYVLPDDRQRLLDTLSGTRLKLVASGHVHQHRLRRVDGIDHCWAPSTAFILPDSMQPRIGTKQVGYVAYAFGEDDVTIDVVEAPELTNHDLANFRGAYGH